MSSTLRYTSLLGLLSLATMASSGFVTNYTSRQIAAWDRPRAAQIRDYVYLEGGDLQTGQFKNGAWDPSTLDLVNPTEGLLFNLSLHRAFGVDEGSPPAVFQAIPEPSITNYYFDGYMFADYNEFYAWG
jgi:hypothetical protein